MDVSTVWWRRHSHEWQLWQEEWSKEGFPEDLSAALCQDVHAQLVQATQDWCDLPEHDLTWAWCEVVEGYSDDSSRHAQAIWAFALWGRTGMYDRLDTVDDIDCKLQIEDAYLTLLYELPVARLVDRLERLHRAVPPDPLEPVYTEPVPDQRSCLPLEPVDGAYDHGPALLRPYVDPEVCEWPEVRGVPICELTDGTYALIVLHFFSGRRRPGDGHEWAHFLIEQYFHVLSWSHHDHAFARYSSRWCRL